MIEVHIKHRYTGAVLYTAQISADTPSGLADLLSACRETPSGCFEWTLHRVKGRGRLKFGGRQQYAHRVAWQLVHGPIPAGMLVLHRCDNPACLRPEHLFLGTHAENMADMVRKGRSTRGRPLTAEHRRKVSLAGRGRQHSAETKARIAASVRAYREAA